MMLIDLMQNLKSNGDDSSAEIHRERRRKLFIPALTRTDIPSDLALNQPERKRSNISVQNRLLDEDEASAYGRRYYQQRHSLDANMTELPRIICSTMKHFI
ncbi:hypothetical protein AB6A40_001346 [Gnathostoma spinigerum]|uniref:Uncharacterized protein n=1 Tax=Gnathostoma spinigerum TaxID=75299 RepID=A0ABD6E623_9BILA